MLKSKIIGLLRQLDSRTLSRFGEYAASPYFNKHQTTRHLCQYLIKEAPAFKNENKLKKERIFKNIFPEEDFDAKNFHRQTSLVLKLLQNFLVDDAFQKQKQKRSVTLLAELRKYKLEKNYRSIEKKHEQALQNSALSYSQLHENQYKFYKELDKHFVEQGGREYNENLQLANDYLDCFFILEKLKMACDMASRNKVIQANYQWSIMKGIEEYLEHPSHQFSPIIGIYHCIFRMLTQDEALSEAIYKELKSLLDEHASTFTKTDTMETYGYALNYAIGQINKKGAVYLNETLEIYQYLVEREAIFVGGHLMPQEYKNIVTLGLRLEKYDWTEHFIESYKNKLPAATRNNSYKYNLASLQHSKGDYDSALETLYNVDFVNPTYYLGTKIIQLKIYYDLGDTEALYALIDACLSYLRRSDLVAEYQKKSTKNLMQFAKKLYKIKDQVDFVSYEKTKAELQQVELKINACSFVANKDWLESNLSKLQTSLV